MADHTPTFRSAGPSQAERRAHETFRAEVGAAMSELAQHYGFDGETSAHTEAPTELRGHQVAGIIGFAGDGFGGTLAIRAPSTVVRRWLPISITEPGIHQLGDWTAELANQLLGRAKNKIIRLGTTFQITPPTYAIADELLVLGCDPQRTSWIEQSTTAGPMLVMVELHATADFAFQVGNPGVVPHAEGDLLLF